MTKLMRVEIAGLYVYWVAVAALALIFNFNFLVMTVSYVLMPALYLAWRNRMFIRGSLIESFFYSAPLLIVFGFIANYSRAWSESTQFGFYILDHVAVEMFLWGFFYILLLISFYSYFFDQRDRAQITRSYIRLATAIGLLMVVFFAVYVFNLELLNIKYIYSFIAFVFVSGTLAGLSKYPRLAKKTLLAGLLLLPAGLIHEVVSLKLQHWHFPVGYHLAYLQLAGVTFPIEELVWIMFAAPFVIIIHEYFADNLT